MSSFTDNKNFYITDSNLHGKGLFSRFDIVPGKIITRIHGELIDADECVRRESEGNVYIFWKNDEQYVDVNGISDIKYINHSCNYNCDVDEDENGNLILIASREISAGEELTIDYGYEEIYEYCSCNLCSDKSKINSM